MTYPTHWGHKPADIPLYLVRGQDFRETSHPDPSDPLQPGSSTRLEIRRSDSVQTLVDTWDGITTSTSIEYTIQSDRVNSIPRFGCTYYLYISFPDDTETEDYCISLGPVIRL